MQKYKKKKKHPQLCSGSVINSLEFFVFTVVFLQPFFLFYVFLLSSSLWIPFRVIYHGFCSIFTIHMWVRCWEFPRPISHLLESFAISCKAACLLFRHHLHINAARELVGKHLMWRQQLPEIFVILHPYPLFSIFPSLYCGIPFIYYIKGRGMFPATSDRSSEMNILLGYG